MHKPACSTRLWIVPILTLALAGCWIPENFDTRIAINKDGSYTFTYDHSRPN